MRWIAVPIAAYLLVTIGLPAANGATARGDFGRHAIYVLGGCVVMATSVLMISVLADLIRFRRSR